jgi:urease accessory protein UreE
VPDAGALAGLEADAVELTAQERRRARRRVVTRAGRVFTLALSAEDGLVPGRVLHVGPG